ncbi:hypothetical protein BD410DRAFT_231311 [Rickenella mellea]|uniref:DUF7053 domain-containing protein n=1 Tax=Rickenella mellea TaxID=50990 RepID=A0A4Y7QND2_9AGAM|nr:hypothetical protein BD410DRAFT_231311 [Rickenella mellea]
MSGTVSRHFPYEVTSSLMFFTQRTVVFSKIVHVPVSKARCVLEDPKMLINLSPLVEECEESKSGEATTYVVTDIMKVWGIYWPVKYTCTFKKEEDALLCEVNAGRTVRTLSAWRVKAVNDGKESEVSEEVKAEVFTLLMPYVLGQIKSSHLVLLDRLAAKLELGGREN